jgi:hypothetical protein
MVSGFARRFQSLVDKIRSHAAKIEQLAQREYTTILLGNKNILDLTAKGTVKRCSLKKRNNEVT